MEITLVQLVEQFAADKQLGGRTEKTIKWYGEMLGRFVRFKGDVTLPELGVEDARGFIASLQAQENRHENNRFSPTKQGGLSTHTISCYVRVLRSFPSGFWMKATPRRICLPDSSGRAVSSAGFKPGSFGP